MWRIATRLDTADLTSCYLISFGHWVQYKSARQLLSKIIPLCFEWLNDVVQFTAYQNDCFHSEDKNAFNSSCHVTKHLLKYLNCNFIFNGCDSYIQTTNFKGNMQRRLEVFVHLCSSWIWNFSILVWQMARLKVFQIDRRRSWANHQGYPRCPTKQSRKLFRTNFGRKLSGLLSANQWWQRS